MKKYRNQPIHQPPNTVRPTTKGNVTMYEIIWSYREDKFVIRSVMPFGNVVPRFIGTHAECKKAINNFNPN
jgi:hypothetical protein